MSIPPKPNTVPVVPEQIPSELTRARQWVVWQWEWLPATATNPGRWDKPPLTTVGTAASSTNPETWSTFDQALEAYRRLRLDGLGRVVINAEDLVGWDFDHCCAQVHGPIAEWAYEHLARLRSYSEWSPSGTGVRVWTRGRLPSDGRKKGHVEVYSSGRYFTVTGARHPDFPSTVEARPHEIIALHSEIFGERATQQGSVNGQPIVPVAVDDADLLARARRAKNGLEFSALWDGQLGEYPSQSEADLALCGMLAFWCGRDPARVDRLFRCSGLIRAKWDAKHYSSGATYGQHTIDEAISSCMNVYTATPRPRAAESDPDTFAASGRDEDLEPAPGPARRQEDPADAPDVATEREHPGDPHHGQPPPPSAPGPTTRSSRPVELHQQRLSDIIAKPVTWVWRGRYARGFLTGLFGDGGTCKSTLDLTVTARLTTGAPMPFETTTRPPGTCVILSLEDDAAYTLKPRFIAAGGNPDRLIVISSLWNPQTQKRIRQVELERDLELLRAALIEHQAVHFTISPVSAYLGSTRNSWKESDVRAIIDPLHDMAASLNISGTLIAHPNKNTTQRAAYRISGSQAFRNACRIVLVTAIDPEDPEHERLIVGGEKSNIGELALPLAFHKVVKTYPIDAQEIEAVSLDFDLDQDLDRAKYTADYLLSAPLTGEQQDELAVAKDFLTQTLGTAAERVPSTAVQQTAASLGIARRTLERARQLLKVRAQKQPDGSWAVWIAPKDHPTNKARRASR